MLILASNSPRRKQLLGLGGWGFEIKPVEIDENPLVGEQPKAYVRRLAASKARAAAGDAAPDDIIVAADTTVVDQGEILGKPSGPGEAEIMLRRLRGRRHQVYTALAVLRVADGKMLIDWCVTEVPMREYTDDELQAYLASGDPLDKAGAYAIQHREFHPVVHLEGCYANVVGLPLCHLVRTLHQMQIEPDNDVPAACQSTLQYDCSIFPHVLSEIR